MVFRLKRKVLVYPSEMARVLLRQIPTKPKAEHRLVMAIIQNALDDISSPSKKSDHSSAKLFFSSDGFFDYYCASLGMCPENAHEMITRAGYDIPPRKGNKDG